MAITARSGPPLWYGPEMAARQRLDPAAGRGRDRRAGSRRRAAGRHRHRHRRDRPAAPAGTGLAAAGRGDPRGDAAWPRLHPGARRAGAALDHPAMRHRLFRPGHPAGRAGLAERDGPYPRPCEGYRRRLRKAGPPRLPDRGAAALPLRFLRYRRAAVPEAGQGGRQVQHRQQLGAVQRDAAPPPRPAAGTACPGLPGQARRGAGRRRALVCRAGLQPDAGWRAGGELCAQRHAQGAALPRGAAHHPGAGGRLRRAGCAGRGPGDPSRHGFPARRHAVRQQPLDHAFAHGLRGFPRPGGSPPPVPAVAGLRRRSGAAGDLYGAPGRARPRRAARPASAWPACRSRRRSTAAGSCRTLSADSGGRGCRC